MLIDIGNSIHNFLLKLFPKKQYYIGRIYAFGVMITVVTLRLGLKLTSGILISQSNGNGIL